MDQDAEQGRTPRTISIPDQRAAGEQRRPADLVLEGGGVKGIGLVGAVLTLDEAGWTFPRVAGTSAGAIAAALIAALQKSERPLTELKGYLEAVDYGEFMRPHSVIQHVLHKAGDMGALLLHQGIYDGNYLVEWLGGLLEDIGVTTFGQLRTEDSGSTLTAADDKNFSLVVHTADITRGKLVRLPWEYRAYGQDPDEVRIVDAVRASMSIPFFFEPVRFTAPPATFGGASYDGGKVTWVDGGMLSNFPVEVFDRTDGSPGRWPTIGVKLSARPTQIAAERNPGTVVQEALACLRTLLDNSDRYYLSEGKARRTIFVDNAGIKATEFHLSDEQRELLYTNGVAAANEFLTANPDGPAPSHEPSAAEPVKT
jgi:NTE family protein